MMIDRDTINSLLTQVNDPAGEVENGTGDNIPAPSPANANAGAQPRPRQLSADVEVLRILKIGVPVIVQLAGRLMPISIIRNFAPGAIIEFEKSVEDDLTLLANNRVIGSGTCIKVGENFGLRITKIQNTAQRIKSLGPQAS